MLVQKQATMQYMSGLHWPAMLIMYASNSEACSHDPSICPRSFALCSLEQESGVHNLCVLTVLHCLGCLPCVSQYTATVSIDDMRILPCTTALIALYFMLSMSNPSSVRLRPMLPKQVCMDCAVGMATATMQCLVQVAGVMTF